MMTEIIVFKPKSDSVFETNLADFIELSKNSLAILSEKSDWAWEHLAWEGIGSFTKHGHRVTSKNMLKAPIEAYMSPAFIEFAKAFIRYRLSTKGGQVIQFLLPLRALEEALIQVTTSDSITKSSNAVFDEAAANIRRYTSVKTAQYDHGRRLQVIAEFITEKTLAPATSWKSPFSSVKRYNSRLDGNSKIKSSSKLPSDAALNALAEIFASNPEDAQARFASSYAALLMCAPSRVSEVLNLDINCIYKGKDSDGKEQLGLRWHAKKGGDSFIKYVPSSMQHIAEEAISRLKQLSDSGREVAKWYEENDCEFYRPESLRNIPENRPLTHSQLCELLNVSPNFTRGKKEIVRQYLRNNSEIYQKMLANDGLITFADLNNVSRQSMPSDFPFLDKKIGLKWSDSLFCYRLNELHYKAVRPYELWVPSNSTLNSLLNKTLGRKTIFERYNYKEQDGTSINITSHQFRHYLNTLAQKGALGELDVAKWSGRANIHQNATYNHMNDDDHIERVSSTNIMASIGKPLSKIIMKDPNAPVTVADLDAATSGNDRIAHVTEFGFCIHDFAFSPCQKCADCLNCSEQVCVKGDDEKLGRLKRQRNLLATQLENAIQADKEETWGANRWVSHQSRTIDRLDNLIHILESDEVTDGAAVRLKSVFEDTPVKRFLGAPDKNDSHTRITLASIKQLLEN